MKIVKFNNGCYGVRAYWLFGWKFVDLISPSLARGSGDSHFRDCMGSKARVEDVCYKKDITWKVIGKEDA